MLRSQAWIPALIIVACQLLCPRMASAGEYLLGPGDRVTVVVAGHADFGGTVTVTTAGTISLPVVNEVSVQGMSVATLTQFLTKAYSKRLLYPDVNVSLAESRSALVYVTGDVKKPGSYPLATTPGVVELLLAADGLARPLAETHAALLRKASGERIPIDLAKVLSGDPTTHISLEAGDVLSVEAPPIANVYVVGSVNKPGQYPLSTHQGVFDLIMSAGGLSRPAVECHAVLNRMSSGERIPIDLAKVLAGDFITPPITFATGDVLSIGATPIVNIYVSGAVTAPGVYPLPNGVTVSQAILAAKGLPGDFSRFEASVLDGTAVLPVDLDKIYGGDAKADLVLKDQDMLQVKARQITVIIAGEAKQPGTYQLSKYATMADALLVCGGPTPIAALSAVQVLRADGSIDVYNAANAPTTLMRDGDRMYIPPTKLQFAVFGSVHAPGFFPLADGHTVRLSEAMLRSGGLLDNANVRHAYIIRRVAGKLQNLTVNVDKAFKSGDDKFDVAIEPNDIIYITKASALTLNDIANVLSGVSSAKYIFGL